MEEEFRICSTGGPHIPLTYRAFGPASPGEEDATVERTAAINFNPVYSKGESFLVYFCKKCGLMYWEERAEPASTDA